jgi:hypothetical protein
MAVLARMDARNEIGNFLCVVTIQEDIGFDISVEDGWMGGDAQEWR